MNQVVEFDQWIEVAKQMGYRPRFEYFGGTGGGACRVGNQRLMFIDLANSHTEQLDSLVDAIASDPLVDTIELSEYQLTQIQSRRKS